jgi:Ion channel
MSGKVAQAWRSLSHSYLQRPYGILFFSLLVTLVAAPVAAEYQLRTWPIELLLIINLAVAAVGYGTSRGRRRLLAIVTLTAMLRILGRWLHIEAAASGAVLLSVLLAVFATIAALRFALRGRKVDSERLSAALSAYLLAGHCFGIVYFQVEQFRTGSFAIGGAATQLSQLDLQTAIYFSFVTLATLGYGDIFPLTPTARGMAISEAILGQLYLAVLVARLVGGAGPSEGPE